MGLMLGARHSQVDHNVVRFPNSRFTDARIARNPVSQDAHLDSRPGETQPDQQASTVLMLSVEKLSALVSRGCRGPPSSRAAGRFLAGDTRTAHATNALFSVNTLILIWKYLIERKPWL